MINIVGRNSWPVLFEGQFLFGRKLRCISEGLWTILKVKRDESIRHFATSQSFYGLNQQQIAPFLDNLHHEFASMHHRLFPDPEEKVSAPPNPTDLEKLTARYRRLQRAGAKIDARVQKQLDLTELDKMLEEATAASDNEMRIMALVDRKKCQEEIVLLGDQILYLLAPDEGGDVSEIIIEMNAGVGGQEAMLFTAELYNMYRNYAGFRGWSFQELVYDKSDMGGIRSARAEIAGAGTFRSMRFEGGVHRVQRVPRTEKFGRVQTSTSSVAILPKPADIDIVLRKADLRVETCRSSGKGGQNVNKLETAVRVVHLPTGLAAECQEERDQRVNKQRAMNRLAALLYQKQLDEQVNQESSDRKIQIGTAARSDKIRTYNFVQDRLTDHRLGENFHNLTEILKGFESFHVIEETILMEHKREAVEEMIRTGAL